MDCIMVKREKRQVVPTEMLSKEFSSLLKIEEDVRSSLPSIKTDATR